NREPDPVTESVNVAFLRGFVGAQRGMTALLEHLAHLLLRRATGFAGAYRIEADVERLLHVVVDLAQRVRRLAETERAGEIAEVPAAGLAGEDVDEERRARAQVFLVVAAVVWNAGVPPLRDDALAPFETVDEEFAVEQPPQIAERHRRAAVRAEVIAVALERHEMSAQLVHGRHCPLGRMSNRAQLVVALGHARLRDHVRE